MNERDAETLPGLAPDHSESEARVPRCESTLQAELARTFGVASDASVDLHGDPPDSVASVASERIEKLRGDGAAQQRYQLKGEIGRGGMGAVLKIFDTDLRRNLAMKVVLGKSGGTAGTTAELEAQQLVRFLEEAQVTGQLDHPGVVPVHELGIDAEGRVYFTMRLVKGEDLSKVFAKLHADDPEWSLTRALGVLLKVCEAMSYAHDKGVIHRDLKPANVMVGPHGAVYVMDWGLARIDGREDAHDVRPQDVPAPREPVRTDRGDTKASQTDSPLVTMDGAVLGTPFYMPPEQAAGNLAEIGPHSDVYALGAMLYHLLTGRVPFHVPGHNAAPLTILARVLAGTPKPVYDLAPSVAPELVSICEKAMAYDRQQRYANMGELAEDLRAYLENRVVQAHRSGAVIELKKWVQRNKALAAMVLAFIVLTVGGSTTAAVVFKAKNEEIRGARDDALAAQVLAEAAATNEERQRKLAEDNEGRARRAEAQALQEAERASVAEADAKARAAELEQVSKFQSGQLRALDVELMGARMRAALIDAAPVERRAELTRNLAGLNFTNLALGTLEANLFERTLSTIDTQFATQPRVQAQLLQTLAETLQELGLLELARDPQERALSIRRAQLGDEHPDTLASLNNLGRLLQSQGMLSEAEPLLREALAGKRRVLGDEHPSTLLALGNMASLLQVQGKLSAAEPLLRAALAGRRRVLGDAHPSTLLTIHNLGSLLEDQGKPSEAEPYFREALEGQRRVLGDDHRHTLVTLSSLGLLHLAQGQHAQAEPLLLEVLEGQRRVLGDEHPSTLNAIHNLAALLQTQGKYTEAEPYYREALAGCRRVLGDEHPGTLLALNNLGLLLLSQGKREKAEPFLRKALEGNRRVLGDDHPDTLLSFRNMGGLLMTRGEPAAAEPYFRAALEGCRRALGDEHPKTQSSFRSLEGVLRLLLQSARESGDELRVAEAFASLGAFQLSRGLNEGAEQMLGEALDILIQELPENDPRRWQTQGDLGAAVAGQGRPSEAEFLLLESTEWLLANAASSESANVTAATGVPRQDRTEQALTHLIELYDTWHAVEPGTGRDAEAKKWRTKLEAWRSGRSK